MTDSGPVVDVVGGLICSVRIVIAIGQGPPCSVGGVDSNGSLTFTGARLHRGARRRSACYRDRDPNCIQLAVGDGCLRDSRSDFHVSDGPRQQYLR
jgi:hypothetical protein